MAKDGKRDDAGAAQKLRDACERGQLKAVGALLAAGAPVDAKDEDGKTALYFAARNGNARVVALLLDHGADLHAVTEKEKSVLYAAAAHGNAAAVRLLLERGHPVDIVDEDKRTAVHGAARGGSVEALKVLVAKGLTIDATDGEAKTAVHYAAEAGHVNVLKYLVEQGLSLDAVDEDETTAVHYAAFGGDIDVLKFLVKQGLALDAVNKEGSTAVHFAAYGGHVDVLMHLVKQGLALDTVDEEKKTAVHYAAEEGHVDVLKYLVKQGLALDAVDGEKKTAVHYAAEEGHVDVLKYLVKQGLALDAVDGEKKTAVHYAAEGDDVDVLKYLVKQGLALDAVDEEKKTAVHYAAEGGDIDVLKYLVKQGLALDAVDQEKKTAVHYAAEGGSVDVLEFLMKQGLALDAVDKEKKTAVHYAAEGGDVDVLKYLVKQGLALDAVDQKKKTAVHYAAEGGDVDVLKYLVKQGLALDAVDQEKKTAVHYAAEGGDVDVLEFLMKYGLALDAVDDERKTVVHYAAESGSIDVLKFLLTQGMPMDAVDGEGESALHLAAWNGHAEAVSFLLERGLSVNAVNKDGESVLHEAAESGNFDVMQLLIDRGADAHTTLKNGRSTLHYAAKSGNADALLRLLEQGHAVDSTDEDGITAFHIAAEEGNEGIMKLLLDHGADPYKTTNERRTALHFAAFSSAPDALKLVLRFDLPIDAPDEDGSTALHEAAMDGDVDVIQLLIDHDADVRARLKDGRSVLHVCAEFGSVEAAKLLVKLGLAIDEADEDGKTPLHQATGDGEVRMMRFLISEGAEAHALTKTRQNIVHLAVEAAKPAALNYALELGVDVNARAKIEDIWQSPLLIAFNCDDYEKAREMTRALCSAGARFDEKDRFTVLAQINSTYAPASGGSDADTRSETALWRSGLCVCVDQWTQEHQTGTSNLTNIPIEVIRRGEASVRTYLNDVAQSTGDDRLHRCKICVVGPSEWGKTSLVQSLKTDSTFLTQLKDRTIGIDLTTCELESVVDNSTVRQEITFWDFAGQDVYHAAHTLFFSQRTLFVLVVNLDAYWTELKGAESKPDQVAEAQMNRFVGAKIFRWIRSIIAHRPDAQFMVVGSKADRLDDVRVIAEIWDDLRDRLDHWKAAFAKGFDADLLPARASAKDIKALQGKLSQLGSSDLLVANIMEVESIRNLRNTVQSTITSSELGFPMWKTYTSVLRSVVKRREAAQNAVSAGERIEKSIIRFSNLRRQLLREIEGLEREACEQILRTLNDLGDVLWYEHDGAGVFKDCVILDPMLVIEVVREVIRHDFSSDVDGKPPTDGRITHSLLSTFPLWKDMDVELMHAFKALLQHFQLAYPADADMMLPESDIIVPAYWNADQSSISGSHAKPEPIASQKSVCDTFAVHRWCWEYEVPSELSETIFVQFAVQSHSSYLVRSIRGYCVEAACSEFATSISLLHSNSPRDVVRIEVSGVSAEVSWHNMRFYLMKMEKVLEGYPGDVVWRSIVYRPISRSSESRHPVGPLVKAIEDAILMGKGKDFVREKMPWMPPDMDWFVRKSWNDIESLQQLRMNHLLEEKLEVLKRLAIVGNTPRQFPALWSLEYIPEENKALLRMSSDLSGRCYHVPLEIDTGSSLLARHASVFKAGVSLFATVVGNAVSLPIVQNVLDFATSAFDNNADHAESVHNLIDKLDISSERFDTRATSKLSPGASMVLLRDLLKAYDDSLDALEISEISNLECAVSSDGEYVWAHESEIAAMEGKLTRCSTPLSARNDMELPPLATPAATSPTSTSTTELCSPSNKTSFKADFKFSVCVDSVMGLSDWDWHKTYCKWQLYFGRKSLTPLAVDVTPTNSDSSCAPSWSTMRTTIESVASVEMLRECRLAVQVKRRSRIGWTKLIGEGEVWLRDFVDEDASQNFACEPVKVPLGATTDRAVVLHLALEH